jgi:hypothetical protein
MKMMHGINMDKYTTLFAIGISFFLISAKLRKIKLRKFEVGEVM